MLVLREADQLHPARHHHVHAVLDHLLRSDRDRHESRAALAIDGHAGDALGQPRARDREAPDVVALGSLLNGAPEYEVLDLRTVDSGAAHGLAHRMAREDRRVGVVEGAPIGLADRCARGGHNHGFTHGVLLQRSSASQSRSRGPKATKNGLRNSSRVLYASGVPSRALTPPPAASSTACAAAVSHSLVGPRRGYTSAAPSATRQNFSELPIATSSCAPLRSRNASSESPRCERLPMIRSGTAERAATRIRSGGSPARSRQAPSPGKPR